MGGREFGHNTKAGISREDIQPTLNFLSQIAGVPVEDLVLLGSAGKKSRSGDIDIAIDAKKYSEAEFAKIVSRIKLELGDEYAVTRPGFRTESFAVPIAGNPKHGRVQIDLKHNDARFLEFSHYSAEGERSKYKGAVRSALLASLVASIYEEGKDIRHVEDGRVVVDVRWGLDVNSGLKRIYRMCPMRKDGKGRKKELENVEPAQINTEFPELEFDARARVIKDPARIVRHIFGPGVKLGDVESAEQLIGLINHKFPELIEKGLYSRVSKLLGSMGVSVPSELTAGKSSPKPADVSATSLGQAVMPTLKTHWREFQLSKNEKTKVWSISVEPDGESFRIRQGNLGGAIRESEPIRKGESGKAGSASYVSAADACQREVERRVALRQSQGFVELVHGQLVSTLSAGIDFSKPFPKNIRTPKPEQFISDVEFERMYEEGRARITRKYDGMGLVVVRHDYGWELYSLQGNRVTDLFPKHVEALLQTDFKSGTILKAEAIMFKSVNSKLEDLSALIGTFSPIRKWQDVRSDVESGRSPEPRIVFYDALFHNGKELSNVSYDQRVTIWNKFPVARADAGLLQSAEFFSEVTPQNWRQVRKELGFEGFVVVDSESVLGKKVIAFSTNVPRPKGSYKLKPNMEEDVVIYAVRMVEGKYESVFTKQKFPDAYPGTDTTHPKAGEWFYCGRVSIAGMRDVLAEVDKLVRAGRIDVVGSNSEGERISIDNDFGVTAVIEFFDRFHSNKFRHPKFTKPVRFRYEGADEKSPGDCVAHYLGQVEASEALEAQTTNRRSDGVTYGA